MKHVKSYRKLQRESSHRKALLRNQATDVLRFGRIKTTVPKAKELKPFVEKLISAGKAQTLAGRRKVASVLFDDAVSKKVCTDLATRFSDRPGGYLRIIRLGARMGDGAQMCNIELVDFHDVEGKDLFSKDSK